MGMVIDRVGVSLFADSSAGIPVKSAVTFDSGFFKRQKDKTK